MCKASSREANEIAGALILLQLWAWDRFPSIAPQRLLRRVNSDVDLPLGARWIDDFSVTEISTHVLIQYRYMLDQLGDNDIVWEPYVHHMISLPDFCVRGHDIWPTTSPLICFHIVEWHHPERVMRQFGFIQDIPLPCDTDLRLHTFDLRGRRDTDWRIQHSHLIVRWANRRSHIVDGYPVTSPNECENDYKEWYNSITRMFITRHAAAYDFVLARLQNVSVHCPHEETQNYIRDCLPHMDEFNHMFSLERPDIRFRRGRRPTANRPRDEAVHEEVNAEPETTEHYPSHPSSPHFLMVPTPVSQEIFSQVVIPGPEDIDVDVPRDPEAGHVRGRVRGRGRGRGGRGRRRISDGDDAGPSHVTDDTGPSQVFDGAGPSQVFDGAGPSQVTDDSYRTPIGRVRPTRNTRRPPCGTGGHR